jgi:hypothetical protein
VFGRQKNASGMGDDQDRQEKKVNFNPTFDYLLLKYVNQKTVSKN